MSRPRTSVPPKVLLAGVVFAMLAVVIVINLRVWLGDSDRSSADGHVMESEEIAPPGDLDQVTREASLRRLGEAPPLLESGGARGSLRNPFSYASTQGRSSARKAAPTRKRKSGSGKPLSCTAIFVGNGTHSALVSGRVVAEGDRVKNYRVGEITDKGVTLIAGGRKKFLPLETKRSGGTVGAPVALGR